MYKTYDIDDAFGIYQLLMEQRYRPDLDRFRSPHIYRGMPNVDYDIITSLRRVCKHKGKKLERVILSNFTKYAALEDPTIESSVWRQMILGQHHGLPTRLLDWMEREQTTVFSLKMLQEACEDPEEYDRDMLGRSMVIVEPPSIEQRIINQYSFFSVIPMDMENVVEFLEKCTNNTVRYVIKKEIRWQIRDLVDQLNMSERIVYPGLDGLSRWLARHFYVKGD